MAEGITKLATYLVSWLLNLFGNIDLSPVVEAIETLTPYLKAALYILPGETIKQIFTIVVAIWGFRLTVRTIRTIWSLIPIL